MTESTPLFGTPEYWQAIEHGHITWEQAEAAQQARETRRQRALASASNRTRDPRRDKAPPEDSRQWARELSTAAMRDDRLTPGAKALLVLIAAEIGDFPRRMLAKGYLARRIKRSARTVQRYLVQLRRYGYIDTEEATAKSGWCIGQRIRLLSASLPFWHPINRRKQGETFPTHTKASGFKTNADQESNPFAEAFGSLLTGIKEGVRPHGARVGAVKPQPG